MGGVLAGVVWGFSVDRFGALGQGLDGGCAGSARSHKSEATFGTWTAKLYVPGLPFGPGTWWPWMLLLQRSSFAELLLGSPAKDSYRRLDILEDSHSKHVTK